MIAFGLYQGAAADPVAFFKMLITLALVAGTIGTALAVVANATDAGNRLRPLSRAVVVLVALLALGSAAAIAQEDTGIVIYDVCKDVEGTWLWWLWGCYLRATLLRLLVLFAW